MSAITMLPPSVRSYVRDFDVRARRLSLLRAAGLASALFLGWMLACCLADRLGHFAGTTRLALLVAGLALAAAILLRPLRRALRREVDWVGTAECIERCNSHFAQRLVTVTSRVLGPAEHRGSGEMLDELLREVDHQAARQNSAALLPLRHAGRAWLAFGMVVVAAAGASRVPGVELGRLAHRFLLPLSDAQPVTTTRLHVSAAGQGAGRGDCDVVQSEPLRIDVTAEKLGRDVALLHVSEDGGKTWSRLTMAAGEAVDRFTFTIESVDRDLSYYVTGGDATSRTYAVRVLRRPAVERFEVRYEYPDYAGMPPLTVNNADGVIEAPAGTRATVTMTATEPLQSAVLTVGPEKILMERAAPADARRRRATLSVVKDTRYDLSLVSNREVAGGGPGTLFIRALPDRPPVVRLIQPSAAAEGAGAEGLRLNPRDIVPLAYQALDDYGLESVTVRVHVNGVAALEARVPLAGDPRRQEGVFEFDLARLPLGIGDVVTLTLGARDRAGKSAGGEPLQVLVSPRSVDLTTHRRVFELDAAAALADALLADLSAAGAAMDEADRSGGAGSTGHGAALARGNRHLTAAAWTATLMRQSLLRATLHSRSRDLSVGLARWVDEAQSRASLAEDLFHRSGASTGMGSESRQRLAAAVAQSEQVRNDLRTVAHGERARAVLADRENLLASRQKLEAAEKAGKGDAAERLRRTMQRAGEEVAAGGRAIGLDPASGDLDLQLRARVDLAEKVLARQSRIDFAAAAREWSLELQRDPARPVALDERLSGAAQAEAVRLDAELVRARDLQLASRAAARIESTAADRATRRAVTPGVLNEFASAVAALQKEHEILRRPTDVRPPDEVKLAGRAAAQARVILSRWSGGPVGLPPATAPGLTTLPASTVAQAAAAERQAQKDAEELALRASAAAAAGDYTTAENLDAELHQKLAELHAGGGAAAKSATLATAAAAQAPAAVASRVQVGPPLPASLEKSRRDVARAMGKAKTLDRIADDQHALAGETAEAVADRSPELRERQRGVADAIDTVRRDGQSVAAVTVLSPAISRAGPHASSASNDPNWRGRATATVLEAQEQLAAMPQQLTDALEAAAAQRAAVARAASARREAAAAPPENKAALDRMAGQAEQDARAATEGLRRLIRPVAPAAVEALASKLAPFAPEVTAAQAVVQEELRSAAQALDAAAQAGDAAAAERSAASARTAIELAQRELARAQESFTERDPLVAARWFASAAADSLSRTPPDLQGARKLQDDAHSALSRAWDQTIHEAAARRLAALPTMQGVMGGPTGANGVDAATAGVAGGPAAGGAGAGNVAAGSALSPTLSAAMREWGRLRPREPQDLSGSLHETDPPGYEDALKLYFEALGKARGEAK